MDLWKYLMACLVFLWNRSEGSLREAKGLWPDNCLPTPSCKSSEVFRSFDGSCNNLEHPAWGMVNTPLVRVLPARYHDGVSELPCAKSGNALPLGRALRTFLFPDRNIESDVNSLVVMSWGQLITHDTSLINSREAEECCSESGQMLPEENLPSNCLVIEIPEDDEFYGDFNKTCFGLTRAATAESAKCAPSSPVHQTSGQTHFIDASMVYGVSKKASDELRTMVGGELKTQISPEGHEYLPNWEEATVHCNVQSDNDTCYKAGDIRVNQQPPLTLLHTLLLREHNLLCRQLSALNPHWSDERLFQEARRIVIAQVQHITYTQYLPVILGSIAKEKFGSTLLAFSRGYSSKLNPGTLTSFTTAAFRAFHSLIPGHIGIKKDDHKCPFRFISLKSVLNKPGVIQKDNGFDDFLRGLVEQPAKEMDPYFSEQITNHLFNDGTRPFGLDLEAIDITRGRDHGVPSYNTFRAACGLSKAKKFDALSDVMSKTAWTALSNIYEDVDDIDLFVGGVLEAKLPNSLVGPTFRCILMEQFTRWKHGDRFFYEFGDFPGSFDFAQLLEIRKSSLSTLICRNGNNIKRIQPDSFRQVSNRNELQKCKSIRRMNLKPWKEYHN